MENARKRVNIKLTTNGKQLTKLASKANCQDFSVFNESLIGVRLLQEVVKLDKPIYIGFTVLELSKLAMYEFHYLHMLPKYGPHRLKLCFTDTDSLLYEIKTEDIYEDMKADLDQWYDTSDYAPNHPLYSEKNKKIPGKMKDEQNGQIIEEFVGLRAKMYAIKMADSGKEIKKAKGVPKMIVKKDLGFQQYKEALLNRKTTESEFAAIRSQGHQLRLLELRKKALCPGDDKRWIREDGVHTYAYGHFKAINYEESDEPPVKKVKF